MGLTSQIIGVFAFIGMLVAFIPCLGWMNWFVIPTAFIALIFGILGFNKDELVEKNRAKIGIIISIIVIILGSIRLAIGGFIF